MAYPSYAQLVGSQFRTLTDRKVVRDSGGGARVSSYYDAIKHAFTVRHRLNTSDLSTLMTFFASNQTASFAFTWSGDATEYTVVFGPGGVRVTPGGPFAEVEVDLEEV